MPKNTKGDPSGSQNLLTLTENNEKQFFCQTKAFLEKSQKCQKTEKKLTLSTFVNMKKNEVVALKRTFV